MVRVVAQEDSTALERIAISNLGFKFLRAGFIDEASELAKKALGFDTYHSTITDLLKRLKEVPEEEEKKRLRHSKKLDQRLFFTDISGRPP
jgi:hypothetical protein